MIGISGHRERPGHVAPSGEQCFVCAGFLGKHIFARHCHVLSAIIGILNILVLPSQEWEYCVIQCLVIGCSTVSLAWKRSSAVEGLLAINSAFSCQRLAETLSIANNLAALVSE